MLPPPSSSNLVLNYFTTGNFNLVGVIMSSGLNARFPVPLQFDQTYAHFLAAHMFLFIIDVCSIFSNHF
jgi:hypothetical protein